MSLGFFAVACAMVCISSTSVMAGPPFRTDDPEPVSYQHWAVYVGGTYTHDLESLTIGTPFLEANYGPLRNVQVSLTLPMTYERNQSLRGAYHYGDTELGVKFRFVTETNNRPQVAFYPIVDVSSSGEKPRMLLPVWVQKSFGSWTAYGGGGFRHDPNPGARNSFFAGAAILKELHGGVTIGAEVFRETASRTNDDAGQSGFNVGLIRDVGETHAILVSVGRSFGGRNLLSVYGAYEIRLGRESRKNIPGGMPATSTPQGPRGPWY